MNFTSKNCNINEKPVSKISCNKGECNGNYFWRTGNWSQVVLLPIQMITYLTIEI